MKKIFCLFTALCLILCGCAAPGAGAPATGGGNLEMVEVILVHNVDEFLQALAPGVEIALAPGTYNLTKCENYGQKPYNPYYTWDTNLSGGYQLVLSNLENTAIRGAGADQVSIVTEPRDSEVIILDFSENVTLEGFTAGHTIAAEHCQGGVLSLRSCGNVTVNALRLFGCGTIGLNIDRGRDISVTDTEVYECSSIGIVVESSQDVQISNSIVRNLGSEYGASDAVQCFRSQNVQMTGCSFYDNDLWSLWSVYDSENVNFSDNSIYGNTMRNCVFNYAPEEVTAENNTLDSNMFPSLYTTYDWNTGERVEYDLPLDEGMQPTLGYTPTTVGSPKPVGSRTPQEEVTVTDVDSFLQAIGPNKRIIVDAPLLDFSTAKDYGWTRSTYYYWDEQFDGPELVIFNVENMTIEGKGDDRTAVVLSAVPRYADVLSFLNCEGVTLRNFTAGHTVEPGSCAGGVVSFENCVGTLVDNCGLYGCGILGISYNNCVDAQVMNSEIYECSQGGITAFDSSNIVIAGTLLRDLGGNPFYFSGTCSNVTVDGVDY